MIRFNNSGFSTYTYTDNDTTYIISVISFECDFETTIKIINNNDVKCIDSDFKTTTELSDAHNFGKTISEAIGVINNIVNDKYKIGDIVNVKIKDGSVYENGEIVPNKYYNDDYPYAIKFDGHEVGYFSEDQIFLDTDE